MTWVTIGYLAKRRAARATWVSPWPDHPAAGFPCGDPVEEICSVSGCIAAPFEDSESPARSCPLGLHPDPGSAWAAVPADERGGAELYAYRLWPVQFDDGNEEAIDHWWEPDVAAIPATFARLGWDAVVGGNSHSFGCSPLSCNSGADVVRCPEINRHCLMDDETSALALARRLAIAKPEPGPYCVVEVWRAKRPRSERPVTPASPGDIPAAGAR